MTLGRRYVPYRGRRRKRRRACLCAGLLLLWMGWGVWRSYHMPVVRRWEVPLEALDSPVRLAVLSDLHDRDFGNSNQALIALTAAERPDLILLAGDMLNADSDNSALVRALVERLAEIAPVCCALGNQELDYLRLEPSLPEELEAAGAAVLDRRYLDITVNGAELRVGGLYDYAFAQDDFHTCDPQRMDPEVYGFLREFQDTERCKIMLSHRPDSFIFGEAASTWEVDLVVSGHNHGGQVVLPVLGGLYGGDQGFFPQYCHGIHEKDNITLAVTSGLGTHRERLPRFRNPPEIMVLDLKPSA